MESVVWLFFIVHPTSVPELNVRTDRTSEDCSDVVLEDMFLVSRRLKDLNKSLGLGTIVLGLGRNKMVLVLRQQSCLFQDPQLF